MRATSFLHTLVNCFTVLIGVTLLLGSSPSDAQRILYQTGFESPDFVAGQPVTGQQDWIAGLFNDSSPAAGVVSTVNPNGGLQDLQVNGKDLTFFNDNGLYTGVYRPNDTPGAPHPFFVDLTKTPQVLVQADVRLDGPMTSPPISGDLYSANLNVYNKTDDIAEMWVSSDGHLYSYGDGQAYQFSQPITFGQYYQLGLLLDFANKQNRYYVDGVFLGSLAMPASIASNPSVVFNLCNFGAPDFGSYSHSDYTGYLDNVLVVTVPEPGSLALLTGFGLVGVLLRRRK